MAAVAQSSCAVLSVDAAQAFDRVEHHYIWEVMKKFGFGSKFVDLAKILYSQPTAMVMTGNICSAPFSISRSARQGCPFSPSIFALSLEPLAQAIRQSPHSPILVSNTPHYISLYCDDILLFSAVMMEALLLLIIFDRFNLISGFKINWTKSALMPLNDVPSSLSVLPIVRPQNIEVLRIPLVDHFKYLGIEIFPSSVLTAKYNFDFVRGRIEGDLSRWATTHNSFQTRVSIIKMIN